MSGHCKNSPLKKWTVDRAVIGCEMPTRGLSTECVLEFLSGTFRNRVGELYIGENGMDGCCAIFSLGLSQSNRSPALTTMPWNSILSCA
jgi:hypothetical protein